MPTPVSSDLQLEPVAELGEAQRHRAVRSGEVDRVAQEVDDHAHQTAFFAEHREVGPLRGQGQPDPLRLGDRPQLVHRARDRLEGVDRPGLERDREGPEAGEVQDLVDHGQHAARARLDELGEPQPARVDRLPGPLLQGLGGEADRGEGISQVVRDVREELLLELVDLAEALRHAVEGRGRARRSRRDPAWRGARSTSRPRARWWPRTGAGAIASSGTRGSALAARARARLVSSAAATACHVHSSSSRARAWRAGQRGLGGGGHGRERGLDALGGVPRAGPPRAAARPRIGRRRGAGAPPRRGRGSRRRPRGSPRGRPAPRRVSSCRPSSSRSSVIRAARSLQARA